MRVARHLLPLALLLALLGCDAPEERADRARTRFADAVWHDDVSGALRAWEDLRDALPDSAASRLELARLLSQAGETARALAYLDESRGRFPDDVMLHLAFAEAALGLGDSAQALEALASLPGDGDDRLEAILLRARAHVAIGDLDAGLAVLEAAEASRHPESLAIRSERIQILSKERRHHDADALLVEMLTWPDVEGEHRRQLELLRADSFVAREQPERALALLDARLAEDPLDAEAWRRRADVLIGDGRAGELVAALERTLDAYPEEGAGLLALLASAELARGDVEAAEAVLRRLVERAPSPQASAALANHLYQTGRAGEGADLLDAEVARLGDAAAPELAYLAVAMRLSTGDRDAARAGLDAFHERHPSDPRGEYLRARMELADGKSEAAARRLARLAPRLDRSDVQHWLGVAFERSGDLEGAEYRYALAIARNPGQIPSYLGAIRVLERRGAWDLVERFARRLIQRAPGMVEGFDALARAFVAQDEPAAAQEVLRRYAERSPSLPGPVVALSGVLRSEGDAAGALALLDAHAGRFGAVPDFVAERAIALGALGRGEEARAALEGGIAEHPDHVALLRARAYLLFRDGRGEEALADVERALERLPSDPTPLRMAGDYWSIHGRFDRAAEAYERALAIRPADAKILFRLAVARERSGDDDAAIEAYRRAVEVAPRSPAPRNNLALRLADAGRTDEALSQAQAAFALAPSQPVVMDTLARLYLEKGLASRAAALLERAAAVAPESEEIREHLERARREAARAGEAVPDPAAPASPGRAGETDVRERLARIERPNVVLVVVDTLRPDWTSPYGFDAEVSPELQRWADAGVVFERVRAQSSWTKVSMASFFTSLWPQRHGVRRSDDGLAEGAVTLAELLREAGYRTYAVQSNGWLEQSFGFHQGFDHYVFPRALGSGARSKSPSLWPHGERVLREGLRLLEAHEEEAPFFLYLHFMDVHEYAAPPEFKRFGAGKRGAYLAAIRWTDDRLTELRRALERKGAADETVLVFASDHGEAFGENGAWGHARNVFTPVLEVPLVIRFPFRIEPRRVRAQVRNIDVAPTILDVAGVPAPDHFDGESLLPLVDGEARDRVVFAALGEPIMAGVVEQVSVNDGRWSLARDLDAAGRERLFDRRLDPREDADLLELEPEAADAARELLDAHLARGPRADGRVEGVRIDPGIAERLRALGYLGVE